MVPRSFFTNVKSGDRIKAGAPTVVRGIAFGGDTGVSKVDVSQDGGATWQAGAARQGSGQIQLPALANVDNAAGPGEQTLMVRCTNSNGLAQSYLRLSINWPKPAFGLRPPWRNAAQ